MTDNTHWLCIPCEMEGEHGDHKTGHVTVHGEGLDRALTVWCPWCGDKMEPANKDFQLKQPA